MRHFGRVSDATAVFLFTEGHGTGRVLWYSLRERMPMVLGVDSLLFNRCSFQTPAVSSQILRVSCLGSEWLEASPGKVGTLPVLFPPTKASRLSLRQFSVGFAQAGGGNGRCEPGQCSCTCLGLCAVFLRFFLVIFIFRWAVFVCSP